MVPVKNFAAFKMQTFYINVIKIIITFEAKVSIPVFIGQQAY
jgi:hypothetical protein